MAKAPVESGTSTTLTQAEIDAQVAAEVARVSAKAAVVPGFKPYLTTPVADQGATGFVGPTIPAGGSTNTPASAIAKATAIMNADSAATDAYQAALVAPAKTQAEVDAINAQVKAVTESTGNVYNAANAMKVASQPTINPNVVSTSNYAPKDSAANTATTAKDILRQALLETGMPADVAESSLTFVQSLIDDGIAQTDAIHHLYNFKDFTTKAGSKLTSPFYAKYTSPGEGLTGAERKTPLELMQFTLTTEKLVKNYGFSDKFASYDSLKKYVQNNVSATDLEPRMQAAKLKTSEADPTYVAALQKMGYISGAQDLADFFLDPNIGQQQLEVNRTAASFAQANLQRSGAGLTLDPTQIKRISAQYAGMGETKALATAAQGYETIGQTLAPEYQLATMYEQPRGTILTKEQQVDLKNSMQAQLENEQFMGQGLASQERKRRLAEQAANAFQSQSGTYGGRSTSYSRQSTAGMI